MAGAGPAEPSTYLLAYIGHACLRLSFKVSSTFRGCSSFRLLPIRRRKIKWSRSADSKYKESGCEHFKKGNSWGATARNSTYEEDSKGVWEALHHQLIILKVVIANVQHFIRIEIRRDKNSESEANHDVSSSKMQHACSQSDA